MMEDIEKLDLIKLIHGHIGPNVVLGYKMGRLALKLLGVDRFSLQKVVTRVGSTPPTSCAIDGIQLSCGASVGRGNLKICNASNYSATFISKEKGKVIIKLSNEWKEKLKKLTSEKLESLALEIWNTDEEKLFVWK